MSNHSHQPHPNHALFLCTFRMTKITSTFGLFLKENTEVRHISSNSAITLSFTIKSTNIVIVKSRRLATITNMWHSVSLPQKYHSSATCGMPTEWRSSWNLMRTLWMTLWLRRWWVKMQKICWMRGIRICGRVVLTLRATSLNSVSYVQDYTATHSQMRGWIVQNGLLLIRTQGVGSLLERYRDSTYSSPQ